MTPSAHAAEYKQVTVLFADVVRSMSLATTLDLERLREIMTDLVARTAAAARHYGATVESTGDGVMAVFGAPVALEDHAVRACLAALEIQQEAGRLAAEVADRDGVELRLRVGLNSGLVIAGEIGGAASGYEMTGSQVGFAQRMESVAPPGAVLLSESTARLVEHLAVLGKPELFHVKGFDEPVPGRPLLSVRPRHAGGAENVCLVGRRPEMTVVDGLVGHAVAGRGEVVNLVGSPGVGKSRLARETAKMATDRGLEMVWAFCESHTREIPFRMVSQLLRASTGINGLDDEAARGRLRTRFPTADTEDLALLEELLGISDPSSAQVQINADARRRRLTALIKAAALDRRDPVLYVIEDVHWIDAASESMLADLLTVLPEAAALVVVTHRPEYRGALTRIAGMHTITLAPLSNSEAETLLDGLLGSDPSIGGLASTIADRAAGNPFFTEEMVRELAQRGVLTGTRGSYLCQVKAAEVDVPATVQATIEARIDRLTTAAKKTLSAAAVIGAHFEEHLLTALGVEPAFDELLDVELIDRVGLNPATFTFHHPLIRAVAYESQLKADRAEWHRRLATTIESDHPESADQYAALIGEHLQAAGELARAYGWLMRAGAWFTNRDVNAARVNWHRAREIADRLADADPARIRLRIAPRTMLCATAWLARPVQQTWGDYAELQELCGAVGDKVSLAIGMAGLATELLYSAHPGEGARLAAEMMTLLESIGDPALTVGLAFIAFANWFDAAEFGQMLQWSQTVVELAQGDPTLGAEYGVGSPLAMALGFRAVARWNLGLPGWHADVDDAATIANDSDLTTRTLANIWTHVQGILFGVFRAEDATLHAMEEIAQAATRSGGDFLVAGGYLMLGITHLQRNTVDDRCRGTEFLSQAISNWLPETAPSLLLIAKIISAREHARTGSAESAIATMRAAVQQLHDERRVGWGLHGTAFLAETLLERGTEGDLAEADAAIDWVAKLPDRAGSAMRDVTLLRLRALHARARRDGIAFRDSAQQYLAMAESLKFEGHIDAARALAASLP